MLASLPASPKLSPGIISSTFPLMVFELTRLLCPIEEPVCVCCPEAATCSAPEVTAAMAVPAACSLT